MRLLHILAIIASTASQVNMQSQAEAVSVFTCEVFWAVQFRQSRVIEVHTEVVGMIVAGHVHLDDGGIRAVLISR